MKEVASLLLGKVADWLPRFLLRLFFKPGKVAHEVRITLRDEKPIQPRTDAPFPDISIWLEITNLSHIDLTLDRLLFDLWFGQPTMIGCLLDFVRVPARSSSTALRYWSNLTPTQVIRIDDFMQNSETRGRISLNITAYFESKVGMITVKERIEREEP